MMAQIIKILHKKEKNRFPWGKRKRSFPLKFKQSRVIVAAIVSSISSGIIFSAISTLFTLVTAMYSYETKYGVMYYVKIVLGFSLMGGALISFPVTLILCAVVHSFLVSIQKTKLIWYLTASNITALLFLPIWTEFLFPWHGASSLKDVAEYQLIWGIPFLLMTTGSAAIFWKIVYGKKKITPSDLTDIFS